MLQTTTKVFAIVVVAFAVFRATGQGFDFSARYQSMVNKPAEMPPMMRTVLGLDEEDRRSPEEKFREEALIIDSRLLNEARKGDENIIGYVYEYADKVSKIVTLMQTDERNFILAESIYKDLRDVSADNRDALVKLNACGDYCGPVAQKIFRNAESLRSGGYNNQKICFANGEIVTIGQLFGGCGYVANRSSRLQKLGYDTRVIDAYFGEDAGRSKAVGTYITPGLLGHRAGDVSRSSVCVQLNEAAIGILEDFDHIRSTLGEAAAQSLVDGMYSRCGNAGDVVYMQREILWHVEKFGDTYFGELPNADNFIGGFFAAYDELGRALFRGFSVEAHWDANSMQRRAEMMVILSALKIASDAKDCQLDFRDRKVSVAIVDAASAIGMAQTNGFGAFKSSWVAQSNAAEIVASVINAFQKNSKLTPFDYVKQMREFCR